MNVHFSQLVKSEYTNKSVREILDSPIDVLVGVDDEDVNAMAHLDIETVYDLATSRVFTLAREVTMAADGNDESPMAAYGYAPSDATTSGERQSIQELAVDDISSLPGVGEEFDDDVRDAIALTTVRDFSLWPPFLAARAVLNSLTGESEQTEDDEIPEELIPVARQYATERVFYDKAYLDEVIDLQEIQNDERGRLLRNFGSRLLERFMAEDRPIPDLVSLSEEPVDVSETDVDNLGFTEPALGAVLKVSQSWYPEGLSLGQLLHSMTLAPAESTKIAVIDWSRRERGQREESLVQSEQVDASMTQNRSVSEVQNAVAEETQSGDSTITGDSDTQQSGLSGGGIFGPIGIGGSHSTSSTHSHVTTVSNSSGHRDISAEMSQSIRNSTQQHASSARNRRASVVVETSEEESEEVTTRTVTNYNHMHSLNMHYYEVVQMYRTAVQPENAEPVLFVPFQLVDFTKEHVISRYRSTLLRWATDSRTRTLVDDLSGAVSATIAVDHDSIDSVPTSFIRNGFRAIGNGWEIPPEQYFTGFNFYGLAMGIEEVLVYQQTSSSPVTLETEFVENWDGSLQASFTTGLETPIPVSQIERIDVRYSDRTLELDEEDEHFSFRMHIRTEDQFDSEGSTPLYTRFEELSTGTQTLINFSLPADYAELSRLLMEEQLYYSQAIWTELSSQTVAMLLSPYRLGNRPLAEYVETTPLATHGNYVAFRLSLPDVSDEDDDGSIADEIEQITDHFLRYALSWWLDWKDRNYDPTHTEEDLVPLPSGGVHGEAILGQANSAEKLDITRFWDWQESPIPIQAPDIAPVGTGSRTTPDDLTPGSLDAPIVNVQTPSGLPDPSGLSAVLNAVTASNIFRDMSGLEAAAALAQHGQTVTGEGAAHAATTASDNYRTAAEMRIREMEIAASLAAAAMGLDADVGSGGLSPRKSNSGFGAAYNEASKRVGDAIDKARRQSKEAAGGSSASPSGSGGGGNTPDDPATEALNSRLNPSGAAFDAAEDFVDTAIEKAERDSQSDSSSDRELNQSKSTGRGVITDKIVKDDWGRGLFKEEVTNFDVLLYGFAVGKSELLEKHIEILDVVVDVIDPAEGVRSYMGELSNFPQIVGRASQTGPEANNVDLSKARADTVAQYIQSNARGIDEPLKTVGLGSSSPIKDRPGEEDEANRSVSFEFFLKYTYLDMYSVADARDWLRKWLEGAQNATDESHEELLRVKAKGQYLLARNYIDMVENGHRDPPYASPAWRLLLEDQGGEHKSAESRVFTAYSTARQEAAAGFAAGYGLEGDTMGHTENQRHIYRSRTDPYYRYTYGPVKRIVDGEERWVAVREYVEEANAMENEIFGDVTEFVDEEWMSE